MNNLVYNNIFKLEVSERAKRLHQTSREELENSTVDYGTVTLSDDLEHSHSLLEC